MSQFTQSSNTRVADVMALMRQGVFALPFLFQFITPAFGQTGLPQQTVEPPTQPQCRSVPMNISSKGKSDETTAQLAQVLENFESSFQLANADLFASIVSPALLKKKEDALKIFEGTLLEYDLRRVKLQRNWIWDMNVGKTPEPGRLIQCGELGIQPVYGPLNQYAVQYSAFTGSNQTRLFVLFARTALSSGTNAGTETQKPGLVHLQVQRWTYDGRTPERLMTEAKKSASGGEKLVGALLAESAARVMEINPYVVPPLLGESRELAIQLKKDFDSIQSKFFATASAVPEWKLETLVPIFRDGSLAVGVKIRMLREMSLNEQTRKCKETALRYFAPKSIWSEHFSGVECLAYGVNEDLNRPPRGGSQFFPWPK